MRIRMFGIPLLLFFVFVPNRVLSENVIPIGVGVYACIDEQYPAKNIRGTLRKLSTRAYNNELASLRRRLADLKRQRQRTKNKARRIAFDSRISGVETEIAGLRACKAKQLVNACKVIGGEDVVASSPARLPIINGNACNRGDTFVVSVEVPQQNGGGKRFCTGVVVTPWLVITAAHCFYDSQGQYAPDSVGVKVVTPYGEYSAPEWELGNYFVNGVKDRSQDYAFMFVHERILNTRFATVISPGEQVLQGDRVVFGGFGLDDLEQVDELRAGFNIAQQIFSGLISFKFTKNPLHSNTCKGDSGGPLLVERGGLWKVAGLVHDGTKEDCSVGDDSLFVDLHQAKFLELLAYYSKLELSD